MSGAGPPSRVAGTRPTYRVVVRRANDLPREDVRDPGALWLLGRAVAAVLFVLRRAHRRWRVELRQGDLLVLSRDVEHLSAGRVLAELWRRHLAAGAHLDDLP